MRVLVFGTFDHLHPGHKYFLEQAGKRGELWVVVAQDETVEKLKNKKPAQTQQERKESIQSAFPDARVVIGDEQNYMAPVLEITPDLIVMGYDQKLPPGIKEEDFSCPVERVKSHKPEEYKSSILREED